MLAAWDRGNGVMRDTKLGNRKQVAREWRVELGRRIRARREGLGISRGALARRCGVYALFLKDIEEGLEVPELITLYRIGNVLNVSLAELLEGLGP
jgi:ribosome-binding protein aMBF1 (putative translation factor)